MSRFRTAKDLAIILGLVEGTSLHAPGPIRDEHQRLNRLEDCFVSYFLGFDGTTYQRELVCAEFAAHYLPALIDRYIDAPTLNASGPAPLEQRAYEMFNASLYMLLQLYPIPYFSKYFRSQAPIAARGKTLMRVLVDRIVSYGPLLDQKKEELPEDDFDDLYCLPLLDALKLLSICLRFFTKHQEPIPLEARNNLTRYLIKWRHQSWMIDVQYSSEDAYDDLRGKSRIPTAVIEAARRQLKAREKCAFPKCEVKENLRACTRCSIVAYCSEAHQRADWNGTRFPHKPTCFETEY
ncbi:hypothetical protein BDN72DRAFT_847815 [Pluteus cervinus]|uniref:Uncharacterized protein n=1 Tax=Pluteus cervinus TaxID=181527 RepID=A0ACD3ACV9_9AGAR|nr:hypothetical protein BDN72DRAFT_847815 [Pluteus cervinus]